MHVSRPVEASPSAASGCLQLHLKEAIELNRERRSRYSRLTRGASEKLSDRLILFERLGLPVAWCVDALARGFQKRGIPVACDDFVSMDLTPPFRERSATEPLPLAQFVPLGTRRLLRDLWSAYRRAGFSGLSDALARAIAALEDVPTYHCMARHVLESSLRIANLAPEYVQQATKRGARSPAYLSRLMLVLHLLILRDAAKLDADAAPMQARGVAIICQDVPPIAPHRDRP